MGICFSTSPLVHDYNQSEIYDRREASFRAQRIQPGSHGMPATSGFPRLREKVTALEALINELSPGKINHDFLEYAKTALDYTLHRLPDHYITELDSRNISQLAHAYSKTCSDLNMECFDSGGAFVNHLGNNSEHKAWWALVRLNTADYHYVTADIRHHSNGQKTVILLEPGTSSNNQNPGILPEYSELERKFHTKFGDNGRMSIIEVGAQRQSFDCVIFAFNFALNAYRKADYFDKLHQQLAGYGRCFFSNDIASRIVAEIEVIDGKKILPPQFYKHAHSSHIIEAAIRSQPESGRQNVRTSGSATSPETLQERHQAFRVFRHIADRPVSMSIDGSRLTKIRKAINSEI